MDYKSCQVNDIIEWCQDNNEVDWLKRTATKTMKSKKTGKTRKISFIELKTQFYEKFLPDEMPRATKAKKTFYDKIAEL